MIQNKTVLQAKVNDKIAELECPSDMSLGELFDALFQMRAYVVGRMKEAEVIDQESLIRE